MKNLLKWKVSEKPSGLYSSFSRRQWPSATYTRSGCPAVDLSCDDEYIPEFVKENRHGPITIRVAEWHNDPAIRDKKGSFTWRTLKVRANTLLEAKQFAENALSTGLKSFRPTKESAALGFGTKEI